MTAADRGEFSELMVGLAETYAEAISDARMEIYFAALADLSLEALRAAATIHVRTQKFFPRPSELREVVDGTTADRAELAWAAVVRLVRRYGRPGIDGQGMAPEFPDEVTRRAAMELYGGWKALCERLPSEGPELIGISKMFKASYGAFDRAKTLQAALPPMTKQEAKAKLLDIKAELQKRGLPTGAL